MAHNPRAQSALPQFVVFEGVDGTGKSTLAGLLTSYYRAVAPNAPLYAGSFPGSSAGTLGEWVYRLHHSCLAELSPTAIAQLALQLLHVAAHVDTILKRIGPTFADGGYVILDRYWWSTYAYARDYLSPSQAWALVGVEHPFWEGLPRPDIVYVTRRSSLKAHELDHERHSRLTTHYREVIERERSAGMRLHELTNDGEIDQTWTALLATLDLPKPAIR